VSTGAAKYKIDCTGGCSRWDTAWKIFGGGKFNEMFGLEAAWMDLGTVSQGGGTIEARGLNFSLLAGFPIGPNSGVHAKIGTTYGTTETRGVLGGGSTRDHDWGTSFGVGASIGINQNLQVRLDWDRNRFEFSGTNRNVETLMVGLQTKF
jgi:hypothetical protein